MLLDATTHNSSKDRSALIIIDYLLAGIYTVLHNKKKMQETDRDRVISLPIVPAS
jgi:hypothetical protein